MKPAGIILAAGESSRMGRDKALLPYRNSTFLNYILSVFLPRLDPLIVVLGCHAELIRESVDSAAFPEADRERVRVVVNPKLPARYVVVVADRDCRSAGIGGGSDVYAG